MSNANAAQSTVSNILRQALIETQVRNPAYSLRSFARRLAISPSALSEIMNGKRRVSKATAERVVKGLCLGPKQSQAVMDLFSQQITAASNSSSTFDTLDADKFNIVADWYHFGILSLMETEDFVEDSAWIAKRLGIRSTEASAALERMERLKLIKRTQKGKLVASNHAISSTDGILNPSIRKAHATSLSLAQKSLETDPIETRDFSSITMAIDPEKIDEARKIIRVFQDRLMTFMEKSGTQREVYQLCVQLFPVSQ